MKRPENLIESGLDFSGIRFNAAERATLWKLAASRRPADRRRCISCLRDGDCVPANRKFLFAICDRLIADRLHDVRWAALLLLGDWVRRNPSVRSYAADLWPIVLSWGRSPNADIRTGVAVCILEHILEHHFDTYIAKVGALVHAKDRRMADTLSHCWKLGQAEEPLRAARFDALVETIRFKPRVRRTEK